MGKSALRCGTFRPVVIQDRHYSTGDFSGNLDIWDLENLTEPIDSVKAHNDLIHAVDGGGDEAGNTELVTGRNSSDYRLYENTNAGLNKRSI